MTHLSKLIYGACHTNISPWSTTQLLREHFWAAFQNISLTSTQQDTFTSLFTFIYQENPHHEGVLRSAAVYQWWSSFPNTTAVRQQQTPQPRWEWQAVGKQATDTITGCTPLLWREVNAALHKGWGPKRETEKLSGTEKVQHWVWI